MTSKETLELLKQRIICSKGDDYFNLFIKQYYDVIEKDLEVLECFKRYFHFELVFEKNQTYLVFKSKERYLPVDDKLSVANKYYEHLKEWLEK